MTTDPYADTDELQRPRRRRLRDRWRALPRVIRWPAYAFLAFVVLGVLTADPEVDPNPAPVTAESVDEPAPDGPVADPSPSRRQRLREQYTRVDARACVAYSTVVADLLGGGDPTQDQALSAGVDLRTLSARVDNVDLRYTFEGIANDLDTMIAEGVTSQGQQAFEGNLIAADSYCDEARHAYPGVFANA